MVLKQETSKSMLHVSTYRHVHKTLILKILYIILPQSKLYIVISVVLVNYLSTVWRWKLYIVIKVRSVAYLLTLQC